jgi:hypothetical protein
LSLFFFSLRTSLLRVCKKHINPRTDNGLRFDLALTHLYLGLCNRHLHNFNIHECICHNDIKTYSILIHFTCSLSRFEEVNMSSDLLGFINFADPNMKILTTTVAQGTFFKKWQHSIQSTCLTPKGHMQTNSSRHAICYMNTVFLHKYVPKKYCFRGERRR